MKYLMHLAPSNTRIVGHKSLAVARYAYVFMACASRITRHNLYKLFRDSS